MLKTLDRRELKRTDAHHEHDSYEYSDRNGRDDLGEAYNEDNEQCRSSKGGESAKTA